MNKIIKKQDLSENIKLIEVEAPLIAQKALAGQFVVLRIDENGERIPLTVADKNLENGTITIIFQVAGATTKKLGTLKVGDSILNLLGPLGHATEIKKIGTVVVIGGGVGVAEIHPIVKAYKKAGNKVITIIGARSKDLLIYEEGIAKFSSEPHVITDDGSSGRKGFVTDVLKELIQNEGQIDLVYAVGPVPMMEAVSKVTKPHSLRTLVSLNPIMLDATGMCGVCRVVVGGKTQFACVDGPEFDGHLVDFADLKARLNMFKDKEKIALDHICKIGLH